VCAALAGCGQPGGLGRADRDPSGVARPDESAYKAPPRLDGVVVGAAGLLTIAGHASPHARVRVIGPGGDAQFALADGKGQWRLNLPTAGKVRLFGLAMIDGARVVQSEGYLAVTPDAGVAELRAGAGARVISTAPASLRLLALDLDTKGGAILSGEAPPGSRVQALVDGQLKGSALADGRGEVSLALAEPLGFGDRRIDLRVGAQTRGFAVNLRPPTPPIGAPFVADRAPAGWRINWITPGGGLQSTLLVASTRATP